MNRLILCIALSFLSLVATPSDAYGQSKSALVLTGNDVHGLGQTVIEQLLAPLDLTTTYNPTNATLTDFDLVLLDGQVCDSTKILEIRSYLQSGGKLVMTKATPRFLAESNDLTEITDIVGAATYGVAVNGTAVVGGDNPYCLPFQTGDTLINATTVSRSYLADATGTLENVVRWSDSTLCSYSFRAYTGAFLYIADVTGDSSREFIRAAIATTLKQNVRGDIDGSADVNLGDAVYLVNYIFAAGNRPKPFTNNGDVNCDRMVDVSDVVYLVDYIFMGGPSPCHRCYQGTVYVVVAMDTEPYETTGPTLYHLGVDLSNYDRTGPHAYVSQVMNNAFRSSYADSYGGPIKFSFFLETGEYFCHSTLLDCNGIYTPMEKFIPDVALYGDELGWHFHNAAWAAANWDTTKHYWSQISTFNGTRYWDGTDIESAEKALNLWLIDKSFFPTTFRSGWVWENNDFSNWLDEIVPFDHSNLSPQGTEPPGSSIFWDYYDWKRAPHGWVSYHPNRNDYQTNGDLRRTIFRSNNVDNNNPESGLPTHQLAAAFAKAAKGENVYVSVYGHTSYPLTTFFQQPWYNDLLALSAQYRIPFKFATSKEAAKAVLGYDADTTAPMVTLTRVGDSLIISVNETIFQRKPYCALKQDDVYMRVYPAQTGAREWKLSVAGLTGFTIAVGVCDFAGNATVGRYEE